MAPRVLELDHPNSIFQHRSTLGTVRRCLLVLGMLALVAPAAVTASAGVSADAATPGNGWQTFTDSTWRIRVSIPASWHLVPPTVRGVQALISQLNAKNETGLAGVYEGLIGTPSARTQLLRYLFQAFEYSPTATQEPDFALAFARTTKALTGDVSAISASFAKNYASHPGTTVIKHGVVTLPAGRAAFVEGAQVVPNGAPPQEFEIYVLGHGTLLYQLTFRADLNAPLVASAMAGIASRFAFT